MPLRLRYLDDADPRLKSEMSAYTRWLRRWYDFPVPLEVRLIGRSPLIDDDGAELAYPTVAAAIARGVKYYYQAIRDTPQRKDHADRWGDRVMAAYVDEAAAPEPWRGAWRG